MAEREAWEREKVWKGGDEEMEGMGQRECIGKREGVEERVAMRGWEGMGEKEG